MSEWPGLVTSRAAGLLTVAGTPLRREGKTIGILIVYRDRLAPFTEDELALQQSFADQAAIAIENSRLFNERRQRTNDLSESLRQQTATADVLRVIASPRRPMSNRRSRQLSKAPARFVTPMMPTSCSGLATICISAPITGRYRQVNTAVRSTGSGSRVARLSTRCLCRCLTSGPPRLPIFPRGNGNRANRDTAAPSAYLSCGREKPLVRSSSVALNRWPSQPDRQRCCRPLRTRL